MLLRDLKNPERCKHKKIAVEKIKIVEISKPFNQIKQEELDYKNGEEQRVILCLDCGKELERD